MRIKLFNAIPIIFCVAIAVMFLVDARNYMDVFMQGVNVWAFNVLPALLPFSLLSKVILSKSNNQTVALDGINEKLYKLDKQQAYTILASLLCGYPIGAKLACELPQNTDIQSRQKSMLIALCSTAGPVFMIGTLGASFLQNTKATVILISAHYLGAILNGLLYSFRHCPKKLLDNTDIQTTSVSTDFMTDSLLSVTAVGGYVAFFYVVQEMLRNLLHNLNFVGLDFILGMLEMTGGCYNVCNSYDLFASTVLCCALISFGGICVMMQCRTYLKKQGYTTFSILRLKLTHASFSTICCFVLCKLFGI